MIGLGPHGEMVEDAKFLIKAGALLSVYDIKSEARQKSHLVFLRSIGLANYVCGGIPEGDLDDEELIILSHEYPRNSSFLVGPVAKGIPVEYPETLFFKLSPPLTIVGIIGSVGKTSLFGVLAPMLERALSQEDSQNFFATNFESGNGILTHLKKARNGDVLLLSVPGFMMAELNLMRTSPHIAVYTSLPDRHTYKESPFEVLAYQTYNNFLIASDEIIDMTRNYAFKPRSKMLRTKTAIIPPIYDVPIRSHQAVNLALALQTAKLFRLSEEDALKAIEKNKIPRGRLEMVRKIKGVEFWNDASSVSPVSTILALKELAADKKLVLIMGGAETPHAYEDLLKILPNYVHTLVLLPGSGTIRYRKLAQDLPEIKVLAAPNLEEAMRLAKENAKIGEIVLYSPAFEAVGPDISRRERGEKFVRTLRSLL